MTDALEKIWTWPGSIIAGKENWDWGQFEDSPDYDMGSDPVEYTRSDLCTPPETVQALVEYMQHFAAAEWQVPEPNDRDGLREDWRRYVEELEDFANYWTLRANAALAKYRGEDK